MKNTVRFLGVIAIMAVIGFAVSCGDDGDDNTPTDCTNHQWGALTQTTDPTCTAAGEKTQTCTNSGCYAVNQETKEVVNALGHDWVYRAGAIEPTCSAAGSGDRDCERCELEEPDAVFPIDPTAHNWSVNRSLVRTGVEAKTCNNNGCNEISDINLTLALGATGPAGGIIFYRDINGFRLYQGTNNTLAEDTYTTAYYLEAWTSNEVGTYRWSWANEPTLPDLHVNVPLVQQAHNSGTPTQWIGYGLRNTKLIISAMNAMTSNSQDRIRANRAVHVASTTKGGFNDWFLPSVDELNAMLIARAAPNNIAGLPTTGWFWSSSQLDSSYARFQHFEFGNRSYNYKDSSENVRPVRAF